ncbi:MAG: DUF6873 family GME fold protein [Acutalibacteraceae bacterium]
MISLAAISSQAGEAIKKLNSIGIKTIETPCSPYLPKPVNSHADLQMLHFGNNNIFCQFEHLFVGELRSFLNLELIDEVPGNKYPQDVRLNGTVIGDKFICNKKTISKNVLEFAERNGFTVINTNQGYSKCSVCVVNENAIITDDESVFSAVGNFLNDALLISKGSIGLKGYNYGFIGGCCGKISKDILAVNGLIESHRDYKKIIDFLDKHSVRCLELTNKPLEDIGSILPIIE